MLVAMPELTASRRYFHYARHALLVVRATDRQTAEQVNQAISELIETMTFDTDGRRCTFARADDDQAGIMLSPFIGPWDVWTSITPCAFRQCLAPRTLHERVKRLVRARDGAKDMREIAQRYHNRWLAAWLARWMEQQLGHSATSVRVTLNAALPVSLMPYRSLYLPRALQRPHPQRHVRVEFSEPVSGPLIVGDGRWLGLGLLAGEHALQSLAMRRAQ